MGTSPQADVSSDPAVQRRQRVGRTLLALGPAIVVLVFGAVAYDGVRLDDESRALVQHTRSVVDETRETLSSLQDAETGQRGYILTGETRYLDPYHAALDSLRADTAALRALTLDEPAQQRRLDSLSVLVGLKLRELATTIDLRRRAGLTPAVALIRTDSGREAMGGIRTLLGAISAEERALLEQRVTAEKSRARVVTLILVAGTLVAVLLSLVLSAMLFRQAEAEARTARTLAEQRAQLQAQAHELEMQTEQLLDQATELEFANEEMELARAAAERGQAEAEQANRSKSEFLSVMSHELRTPLNAISGHVQLMEMGIHGPVTEAQADALARVQRNQRHLLSLVNDVLNFAKLEAGRVEYDVKEVPLRDVLQDMTPMIEPQLAAKNIAFQIDVPDFVVQADRAKLQQILINLLGNASKFTPEGGRVTMNCGTRDGAPANSVFLRVSDTGSGIPAEKLGSIFEPFVQVDAQRTATAQRGVGLGLAIARDLARGMGGDLRARSTVGRGSVFTLTLRHANGTTSGPAASA